MNNLKNIRKKKQLSITELSTNAGVSVGTISKLENGISKGHLTTWIKLCNYLNVSINDLF